MYEEFSADYDRFVNWPARLAAELPLIERVVPRADSLPDSPPRVLDAACGTGMHAVALAQRGWRVTGADISPEMIARARANAQAAGVEVRFEVAGFGELAWVFDLSPSPNPLPSTLAFWPVVSPHGPLAIPAAQKEDYFSLQRRSRCSEKYFLFVLLWPLEAVFGYFPVPFPKRAKLQGRGQGGRGEVQPFDAVLCLGNSLPHVLTPQALRAALADFAACLRPGGVLVVQNLNYDRILARRERWMEPQAHREEEQEWLFLRFYDFDPDGLLTFNVVRLYRAGGPWEQRVLSTRLWPLRQAELIAALEEAGFADIALYGDMQGAPFEPDQSPNLVVVARRKEVGWHTSSGEFLRS